MWKHGPLLEKLAGCSSIIPRKLHHSNTRSWMKTTNPQQQKISQRKIQKIMQILKREEMEMDWEWLIKNEIEFWLAAVMFKKTRLQWKVICQEFSSFLSFFGGLVFSGKIAGFLFHLCFKILIWCFWFWFCVMTLLDHFQNYTKTQITITKNQISRIYNLCPKNLWLFGRGSAH